MLNHEEFVKLQQSQLQIMDEVHRICVENNIAYYLVYGSGIGAMRHHGFIPWDLDIDIAMLRPDYERFAEVCKKKDYDRFKYWDYKNTDQYNRVHAAMSIQNTSLRTFFDKYNNNCFDIGIFIDIFPLDNYPDDQEMRVKYEKRIKRIKKLKERKLSIVYKPNKKVQLLKHIIRAMLSPISMNLVNRWLDEAMQAYRYTDTKCVCSTAGTSAFSKANALREYYGKPVLAEFEGRQYYVPHKCHEILTAIYGNYMKLPDEKEQKANLAYFDSVTFDD